MSQGAAYDLTTAVLAAASALLRESQRFFRPFGLTAAQFNVLNVLAPRAEAMSQRELSDALVVDRSNVTGLLDRMEAAGWVRRTDDPADRRVYRVSLTTPGRRLWARVEPKYLAAVAQITREISAPQMAGCLRALRLIEQAAPHWQTEE